MKILRPKGNKKSKEYVVDEIEFKDGKAVWKDKKVNKQKWEQSY